MTTRSELKQEMTTHSELKQETTTRSELKQETTTRSELKQETTTRSELKQETTTRSELKQEMTTHSELKQETTTRSELKQEMLNDANTSTFIFSGYRNIDLACLLEAPAKDYIALEEAAWNDFGIGEGLIEQAYLDQDGNPTIGNGTLIYPKKDLYNPKQMALWKKAYVDSFHPKQKAQRSAQFDQIANAQRRGTLRSKDRCPKIITSPATLKATKDDMRYAFNIRFKVCYDRAKNGIGKTPAACPYIDIIPISSQLTILHCYYAGKAPSLEKDPTCRDPQSYPHIIKKIRDVRGPVCSHGERITINDSIQVVNDSIPNTNIPFAEKRKAPVIRSNRGR